MKPTKLLLSMVVMVMTLLTLGSCTSEYNDVPQMAEQTSDAIKELEVFNETFQSDLTTRANVSDKNKQIAQADLEGAMEGAALGRKIGSLFGTKGKWIGMGIGAVVVGGARSAYAATTKKNTTSKVSTRANIPSVPTLKEATAAYVLGEREISTEDYALGQNWNIEADILKIGILHNKSLDHYGHISGGVQAAALDDLIEEEQAVIESKEFIDLFNDTGSTPYSSLGFVDTPSENILNTVSDYNSTVEANRILSLFINGIMNSAKSQSDVNRFIVMYTAVVNKSTKINDDDKAVLKAGFTVMGYSCAYWADHFPDEEPGPGDDTDEPILH